MLIMITMVMVTETIILTIKTMCIYLWLWLAMPSQVIIYFDVAIQNVKLDNNVRTETKVQVSKYKQKQ